MILAFVLGCSVSSAERQATASAAPTLDEALALCPDGACAEAAIVRFEAWDRCVEAADPWDDECRFRQAEAVERTDDGAGALRLCESTVYANGCSIHVLGQQARRTETMADAEARRTQVAFDPRYDFPYWRAFWRTHIDRGDAPGLESCALEVCRKAGEREIEATVDALSVPCAALDRPTPGWIPEASVASRKAWDEALSHHCVADADHPVPAPLRAVPRR